MAKKKKTKNKINNLEKHDYIKSLQEKVLEKLRLMNKTTGLIIGSNSVLRLLQRGQLGIVLLFSKNASSALYHALNLRCKNDDTLFLTLDDEEKSKFQVTINSLTTLGVKKEVVTGDEDLIKLIKELKKHFRTKASNSYNTDDEIKDMCELNNTNPNECCSILDGSIKNEIELINDIKELDNQNINQLKPQEENTKSALKRSSPISSNSYFHKKHPSKLKKSDHTVNMMSLDCLLLEKDPESIFLDYDTLKKENHGTFYIK